MEGDKEASVQRSGGGGSSQRTANVPVLCWPGPAGLVGLCDPWDVKFFILF